MKKIQERNITMFGSSSMINTFNNTLLKYAEEEWLKGTKYNEDENGRELPSEGVKRRYEQLDKKHIHAYTPLTPEDMDKMLEDWIKTLT